MFREFKSCGWEELWRVFSLKSCGQDLQLFLEQGFPTTHGAIYHGQYRQALRGAHGTAHKVAAA